jgi:hypothetical protein
LLRLPSDAITNAAELVALIALSPAWTQKRDADLGTGPGDRLKDFRSGSRSFEAGLTQAQNTRIAGQALYQAAFSAHSN